MNTKYYPNMVLPISSPSTHELYRMKMKEAETNISQATGLLIL